MSEATSDTSLEALRDEFADVEGMVNERRVEAREGALDEAGR